MTTPSHNLPMPSHPCTGPRPISLSDSAVLDALSDHNCVLDASGIILAVNQAWRDFASANPPLAQHAGVGADYFAVCEAATGEDAALGHAALRGLRAVVRGELPEFVMEYACHSPETRRWFELGATRLTTEAPVRLLVTHRNQTQRKEAEAAARAIEERAEQALRESETLYREIFSRMSSGVAVYEAIDDGEDFRFKTLNDAACRSSRIRREDCLGRSVQEVLPGMKPLGLFDVFRRVWKTGVPEHHPSSFYHDERITLWIENYVFRLPSGDIVAVYDDTTERKRLEAERATALTRLAVVEEQERHRISRELHDQIAQRLVALAVELKNLETSLSANRLQAERLRSLRRPVDDLQQQVRQIAWNLRAGELVEGDLESALRDCVEDWSERSQVPVDCECRGSGGHRLPARVEAALYRVAQEALANVEKHARARRVSILLELDAALARLTVEDDGCGFDLDAVQRSLDAPQRLGLLGMRERVSLAGGTLLIESSPGAGTTILVRIPRLNPHEETPRVSGGGPDHPPA